MSLPLIGKTMRRDHSSVLYAVNKIRWSVQTDKTIAGAVDHLMQVPCTRFIPAALAA
jgi:chromosomal replication initiation ATPase DnaA